MSTSRIGGDFDYEALEAFRSAYADSLLSPHETDVDAYTGLPTENISNVSPWLASTGMWKYPSGTGKDDDLRQPFRAEGYIYNDEEDEEDAELAAALENLSEDELDSLLESLEDEDEEGITDEELDNLVAELLNSDG